MWFQLILLPYYASTANPDQSYPQPDVGDRLLQAPQQSVGYVDKFLLYNSITDQPILTLADGDVINVATINAYAFNIVVTTSGGPVGSVRFGYNGNRNYRTESISPYCLCGSQGTNLKSCAVLVVGMHSIIATTYSGIKASGAIGTSQKLSFRIVNDTLLPTNSPTNTPTSKNPTIAPSSAPIIQQTTSAPTKIPVHGETNLCTIPMVRYTHNSCI
jgi:hypothetical protein